jgi:multidrug efflux pump subunit AcrB
MFSRFFIDRPIFASVMSIIIVVAGAIAVFSLPLAQYPEITPPTVEVFASYPGANAQTVLDTVAAPIEQQVNGVENMLYMSSQCTNDGSYTLTVTFKNGTNLNLAQVLVQNRVSLALAILPDLVKRRGVPVKKKSPSVLMMVNLFSPKGTRDSLYLSNYATIQLRDELSRLPGVGDITYLGQRDYSMRVWLDPQKMANRKISASDIVRAIEQQNIQVAAGQIGQPPVSDSQVFQYTMSTLGRLADIEQFGDMILKTDEEGRVIHLRDVARVELGAQTYDQTCSLDGKPSVALSIYQLPGSNALEVAKQIRNKVDELRSRFPDDVEAAIVYDTTPFIRESIKEVFEALRDAVLLVAIVVLVFLQSWRSAIIPLVAVPVAVVGTFAVMAAVGFSLNNLTLFGLVLAIGIVVDDAIVVVEAVEHHIELGLSPRDATIQAMQEVSGPVIAIGLVLAAVFVPCTFIGGIVGQFFRQFAVTIAVSTLISAFNSLTLSPALTALLLRPKNAGHAEALPMIGYLLIGGYLGWLGLSSPLISLFPHLGERGGLLLAVFVGMVVLGVLARPMDWLLRGFFRLFNGFFNATTALYTWSVGVCLRVSVLVILGYLGLTVLTWQLFIRTPTGFIPQQDKGYLLINVQLPDSASLQRTDTLMRQIEQAVRATPGVKHTVSIAGQSLLLGANASNFGSIYVMLDDFEHRTTHEKSGPEIADRLREEVLTITPDALVNVFAAPPVDGLGTAGGFKLVIEDRADLGLKALQGVSEAVVEQGNQTPGLTGLFSSFRADTPWLHLVVDRQAAKSMGVSPAEIFNTLQVHVGSYYVNDFNRFGRTWQVNIQAEAGFRKGAEDLKKLKVRNDRGEMVPLGAIMSLREMPGPVLLTRYNLYRSAIINANVTPGTSSGEGISRLEAVAKENLPNAMRAEWTELALLQLASGNTAMFAFLLAVVLIFLVLAAQYESWSLPLAVILVVPMCLLCAVVAVRLAGQDINIFTQIGFVVLVGLACKNAILIVEFAKLKSESTESPHSPREATLAACRLRLRPILMTSFAFILGVVPLLLAEGAGAEMRQTLGTAVFGGMLGVTLFGIFLTPVFYFVIASVIGKDRGAPPQ